MLSRSIARALLGALPAACVSDPPAEPPPLAAMEEPLAWFAAPDEEAALATMPLGTFSGLSVGDARTSLEELLSEPVGLLVTAVAENSPADAAGLSAGDLLIEASRAGGKSVPLAYPADWRALELAAAPGERLAVRFDRAGVGTRTEIELMPRVRPSTPPALERFREEERAGVVLRSASEVEARRAGLAPGAGAVLVGLAAESPWRRAGLCYGDVVTAVDGAPVRHPAVLLQGIAAGGEELHLDVVRGGEALAFDVATTRRERELTSVRVPLLFAYTKERGASELSLLFGAFLWKRTRAAWATRLLWILSFSGGDADRLEEVDS
jgi:C-terminal processing protease CtpA/Prc